MLETFQKAALAARFADEKKAEDIVLLDVTGLCNFTDAFLICTANNRIQLRAICDHIAESFKKVGVRGIHEDGTHGSNWFVLDCGDVVVHVMSAEARAFYRLEALWGDAKEHDWAGTLAEIPLATGSLA